MCDDEVESGSCFDNVVGEDVVVVFVVVVDDSTAAAAAAVDDVDDANVAVFDAAFVVDDDVVDSSLTNLCPHFKYKLSPILKMFLFSL